MPGGGKKSKAQRRGREGKREVEGKCEEKIKGKRKDKRKVEGKRGRKKSEKGEVENERKRGRIK